MTPDRELSHNPYESPHSVGVTKPPLFAKLWPTHAQVGFLVVLAILSLLMHRFHRDVFELFKLSTVSQFFSISVLLACAGCAVSSAHQRSERSARTFAILGGIICTAFVAPSICWAHLFTGMSPSGLIVFASVGAGMVTTSLMLPTSWNNDHHSNRA